MQSAHAIESDREGRNQKELKNARRKSMPRSRSAATTSSYDATLTAPLLTGSLRL